MNATTFKSRMTKAGLTTMKGELMTRYYGVVITLLYCANNHNTFYVHPIQWSGSHLVDNLDRYTDVCDALQLKYNIGNDAPKGGKGGTYIEVSKSELAKVRGFKFTDVR